MFNKLMYPAVWFLNHVANWILKLMGIQAASEADEAHNEEEIRILMEESHKHGYIDKTELTYLDNVFDFSERHASEIMVPRTDMICLYVEDSFDTAHLLITYDTPNAKKKEEQTKVNLVKYDGKWMVRFKVK